MPFGYSPQPVPSILAGHFRAGFARVVMKAFAESGPGLPFFNLMRKKFPKDPRQTQAEFMGLLSYLHQFAKQGVAAGRMAQTIPLADTLPDDVMPRNYFLKFREAPDDRYLFNFRFQSRSNRTGLVETHEGSFWTGQLDDMEYIKSKIQERILEKLKWMEASKKNEYKIDFLEGSLDITSAFRRY